MGGCCLCEAISLFYLLMQYFKCGRKEGRRWVRPLDGEEIEEAKGVPGPSGRGWTCRSKALSGLRAITRIGALLPQE